MRLVASKLLQIFTQSRYLKRYDTSLKTVCNNSVENLGWRVWSFGIKPRTIFTHATENYVKLKSKDFHVNPGFGILHVNGGVDFVIKPTNVQEYPDADRAFINIYGLPSVSCEGINVESTGLLKDILTVTATPESSNIYCEVQVPVKYDLDVKLQDEASVQILGMEADEVNVLTEKGEMKTKGLKSHNIHIKTDHGNITAEGTLQGNIFINAKTTHLKAKRLQGLMLDIEAEELSTAVESSYMNQGRISAKNGNIVISNLHGCTDLLLKKGQIVVSGFHGQIAGYIGSGKVNVQITDILGDSTLHLNKGTMVLSVIEDPRHDLEVTAPSLDVSKEIMMTGMTSASSNHTFTFIKNKNPEASTLKATVIDGSAQPYGPVPECC
ncbi:protein FAM185A isoform X2 [Panulirus ornatus]|uniref:protein FAM185A isoform X2 n=1 Tax=Panulirus ornatus TaxID=150431 RepID=UPI003A8363F8